MHKIMDLLVIDRLRRWKQSVMRKPFQTLGMLVAVGYFLWILPGIFAGVTNAHIKYIALAANIIFLAENSEFHPGNYGGLPVDTNEIDFLSAI